jgi:Fungal N-terminal domain of STAND proteins
MDPFSLAASIASSADVAIRATSSLVQYAKDTKNASSEKKLLSEEAQNLSRTLERLRSRARASNHDKWLNDHVDIVRQFEAAYDDFAQSLRIDPATGKRKAENRLRALRSASSWSFTKFEVYNLLERIVRLQDYANTLLADDQLLA